MSSSGRAVGRSAVAVLVMAAVVVFAARRAAAGPVSLVPPVRPAPSQPPALGGAPCLPVLGCNPLGGLGEEAAGAMARAVFTAFASFVADGVNTVLQQVSAEIVQTTSGTTKVELTSDWFQRHAAVMRALAVLILLPLMLIGLINAVIHRDLSQLLRAGGIYVPVAIMGGAVALGLTDTAIKLTDDLTAAVTGDLAGSTNQALSALSDAIGKVSASGAPGLGTFLAIVVLLVLLAGALLIWMELLLRTSAIYVVVLFLPVAMSGLVWRATVSWTRRMVEVLVALILSKFVIVVVIDLAAGMIVANDGIGTILQGATLLLLAACAPFALLRLIPMAESGLISHLERMERRPIAAATRAATAAGRPLLGGIEAAVATRAVQDNGELLGPNSLRAHVTEGGELSETHPPEEWSDLVTRPRATATLDVSAGNASGGPTGPFGSAAGSRPGTAAAETAPTPEGDGGD